MRNAITNEQIIDVEAVLDKKNPFYPQVKIVWMAMQDWPSALDNTDELVNALKGQMQSDLTRENLRNYSAELGESFGISGNGWRAETVAGVLELFEFYPDAKTLDEVMERFNLKAQTVRSQANA